MLLVVDIDGTIADAAKRFKDAGPEPSRDEMDKYVEWVAKVQSETSLLQDKVVPGMQELLTSLDGKARIIYVTSREEKWRDVTERWLNKNKFPLTLFDRRIPLVMRPNDCWLETADFKEVAIAAHRAGPMEPVLVIDDDEHGQIEKMCKRHGFTFLKARSGGQK